MRTAPSDPGISVGALPWGVMRMGILRRRTIRIFAVLASGLGLVLALGAAASPDAVAATQVAAGARAAAAGGTWGSAQEVAAVLNTGGFAEVNSVSCASAGNCSAGGFYTSSSGPT